MQQQQLINQQFMQNLMEQQNRGPNYHYQGYPNYQNTTQPSFMGSNLEPDTMRTPKIQVDTPRQTERPQPQPRPNPSIDPDFQQLALKHTNMIKTYIQEINQL